MRKYSLMFAATLVMLFMGSVSVNAQEQPEVEKMAEFPGGTMAMMSFLSQNIKYPQEAKDNNIQGRVLVTFTVQPDGKVTDAHVENPVNPLLDAEAIRVVSLMPAFNPALKADGTPVSVTTAVPVNFRLAEPAKDVILVKYVKGENGKKAVTCTITNKGKLKPEEQQSMIRMDELDSKLKEIGKKNSEGFFVLPKNPRSMDEFNTLQDALNKMEDINVTYKQE